MKQDEAARDRDDAYRKIVQKNKGFDSRVVRLNNFFLSTVPVPVRQIQ
jgi:hypothetical protein